MEISRRSIITRAYEECMRECYKKAQPSANYDDLIAGKLEGTVVDTDEDPIYKRYYLSSEELKYIVNKYIEAYRFTNEWMENSNFILNSFKEGSYKDIYIKGTDDRPGYRSAEKMPPLDKLIGEENAKKVYDYIQEMQKFYRFDREASDFSCNIYLGGSPNSNKEAVIKYWKDHNIDITIEDRDPDTFWYRDEYGDNWQKVLEDEENMEDLIDD